MPHVSAIKQVTGEAVYIDDIPKMNQELYAVIVQSTIAHGRIRSRRLILYVDYF